MLPLALLLALLACSGDGGGEPKDDAKEEQAAEPDPRTLVEVAAAARGAVGDHLVGSATVESEAQATLVPETTGVVTAIHAEEGDHVTKGQLLAVIANPTLEGAFQRAAAERERARTEAATAERLHAQGALSRAELDLARNALATAETAYAEATNTKGFTRLESPIAGTVATRGLRYGEIAAGQPAFTIVDLDRLRIVVPLPERDLPRVKVGQRATLVSAYDDKAVATGAVTRIAPVVDSASGTFRVTIGVDPGQASLRPGQFVSVRVEVDRHEGVLTVPRRALVWEEGKPYVYRVAEMTAEELEKEKKEKEGEGKEEAEPGPLAGLSGLFGGGDEAKEEEKPLPGPQRKAVRLAVSVGYQDGELAEIGSGLEEGAQVVVVGNEALRDGARVRLPGDPTTATAAEPPPTGK